ncbi:MAG: BrnA antitoxin family protein [Octadecabacter sp.]
MHKIEPAKMTKTEKMHWGFSVDAIKKMEYELMGYLHEFTALPPAWDQIWEDDDRRDPKRTKVTINLDADVVKFFKGLGPGYQGRINRVLRAYMHFRLAKLIEGPDTMDYVLRPEKVLEDAARVEWGDTQRAMKAAQKPAPKTPRKPRKRVLKGTQRPWITEGDEFGGPKGR